MRLIAILALLTVSSFASHSQKSCGQHILERQMRVNDPQLEAAHQTFDQWMATHQTPTATRADKIIIPVVFHIIHMNGPENISDAQVLDAMRIINETFSKSNESLDEVIAAFVERIGNANIEFRLAKIDPNGNATTGIDRIVSNETFVGDDGSKLNPWPRAKYLNIWVTDVIGVSGAAAYAYRPPSAQSLPTKDGIISKHSYVGSIGTSSEQGSTTLTHEIGHYLGLHHTWGPGNDPGLSENCSQDDGITDTPNCIGVDDHSCNTAMNSCSTLNNIQNFMDYSTCDVMFTEGQVTVMRSVLANSLAERNKLGTSSNLEATGVSTLTKADYYVKRNTVCAGTEITLYDASTYDPTSWKWTLTGPDSLTSTNQNPTFTLKYPGVYSVNLEVSQGSISKSVYDKNALLATNEYGYGAPFFEDFADDREWAVENHGINSTQAWTLNTGTGFDDKFCYKVPNRGATPGNTTDLTILGLDFRGVTQASLSFQVAFAQIQATNTDKLQVMLSKDCGETWQTIWTGMGNQFSSVAQTSSDFAPASETEWKTISVSSIPLTMLGDNTLLRFRFTGGNGNNLYLDDINIDGTFSDVPRLVYPRNGAPSVHTDTRMDWHAVASAMHYEWQLDVASEFNSASLLSGTTTAIDEYSENEDTEMKADSLEFGQTYYWRVRSKRGTLTSEWSETWSFTVADDGVGTREVTKYTLVVFPNPANDILHLSGSENIHTVQVFSMTGQQVMTVKPQGTQTELNIKTLPSGMYFLKVTEGTRTSISKFVKQ